MRFRGETPSTIFGRLPWILHKSIIIWQSKVVLIDSLAMDMYHQPLKSYFQVDQRPRYDQ